MYGAAPLAVFMLTVIRDAFFDATGARSIALSSQKNRAGEGGQWEVLTGR